MKIFKNNDNELATTAIIESLDLSKLNLKNKNILITGATGDIGKTIAIAAAVAGANLVLMDKSASLLESLFSDIIEINSEISEPFLLPLDMATSTLDNYMELSDLLSRDIKHLDGIIHNAAYFEGLYSILQTPPKELVTQIQVNLTAPIWINQAFFPLLKNSSNPTVLFADHQEITANDAYWNSYAISKIGLMKVMQQLAFEHGDNYNLHSYGYNTGWVNTTLARNAYPNAKTEWASPYNGKIASKILELFNCQYENGSIIDLSTKTIAV